MPSRREIQAQGDEVARLVAAVRDLRQAQLKTADPVQAERLGQALAVMRDRAEAAGIGLAKAKDAYEQLGRFGKALADFRAASLTGKAAMAAGGVAAAGQLPGQALDALAAAAHRVVGGFDRLGSAFGRFVEAAAPAEMMRFQIAIRDLAASFGKIFEPVILAATEFANILNQFITSLQPVVGPLIKQLADAFLEIAKAVLDAVAPIIESLIPIFQLLADVVLPPIVAVFRALSDAIRAVINWIRSWLGMRPLSERPSESTGPRTFAASQARQIGIEQIGEQARSAAFGASSTVRLQQENNALTARTNTLLEEMNRTLGRGPNQQNRRAIAAASMGAIDGFLSAGAV